MSIWTIWLGHFLHDLLGPVRACAGWLALMRTRPDVDGMNERPIAWSVLLANAGTHLNRTQKMIDAVSLVLSAHTIDDILAGLNVWFDEVTIVVAADSRHLECPNVDFKPALWLALDSQWSSLKGHHPGANRPVVRIAFSTTSDHHRQIVIGPADSERPGVWPEVTDRAGREIPWFGLVADALRAQGQEFVVRSNGPLAELTFRW